MGSAFFFVTAFFAGAFAAGVAFLAAGAAGAAGEIDKMKKGDAAAVAESRMAENRWVPVWMQGTQPQEPVNPDALDDDNNHTANAA